MRTSLVLFFAFLLVFWQLWNYLIPLQQVSRIVGTAWIVLTLSYTLSRLVFGRVFVSEVGGEGRALLITGCDTGFGYRLAKRLSRKGFLVFASCLSSNSAGAEELKALPHVVVLELDVTKQEQVDKALGTIKKHLGERELWAVVANAGIASAGLLEWLTMDTVIDVFNVNVFGVLRVIKKFLPLLKKCKGRVVAIASPLGHFTLPMNVPYCMSKHAVVSMMDGLRRECYGKGVDFVTVEPSAYRTSIFKTGSAPMDIALREFKQQDPESIADYTHQDIEDWLKTNDNTFSTFMREDPEEAVDIIEKAVRETCPKYLYRSPCGRDAPYIFLETALPSEITSLIAAITRKIQLRMK
ncbi:short-chain dehydrogenase/reductase family 9C member 7-like [Dermacentor andersoni]|uniref:short-chain dehydrogenase/reductase family 9C member 7-like n=1 Tax=Dermacentor andersoni TaxID=34620 RepID=UPI002155A792|nr:D-beta-hydroxybutyrate dehydrogenase, mitochondrial-like [Dermacentor andersoni]